MSRNVQMTRTPNRTPANRNNRNYTNVSLSPLSHRNQYISSPNLFDYSQETIGRSQVSQNFNHNSTSNSDDGNPRHRDERQRRPGERDDSQRYQGERDDSQRYQAERDEDHRNDLRDVSERDHTRALLGLDVMDDEDPDLQSGDDGITVSMQIPFDMTAREAQKILDKALHERLLRADGTPKRHYDGSKLDGLYSDGAKVWNAMIRTCRLQFSRYLTVPTTLIPEIIDSAVGSEVDRDSTAYSKSYTRILEWRKNWFSMYMKNVDTFQQKLESENFGYQHLTQEQLVTAYKKHFSFEAMYFLMGTMSSVVDWRATISQPAAKRLYKTIFTFTDNKGES